MCLTAFVVPSTCPHLNNFYDAAFYYQEQADASTPPNLPRPPRTPPLADLHTLFTYLHHLSLSTRRLRCLHTNCTRYSGRLHACIGCMYVGCMSHGHIAQHSRDSRHWCAVEVERGGLYCFHCSDYVYHREITKLQDKAKQEAINKKRRREESALTAYDQQLLRTYAVSHCTNDSILGLRGIHNLGNTCYLSVILQHFIHNPLLRNYFLSDMHNRARCTNRSATASLTGRSDVCLACDCDEMFGAFYSGDHTPYGPQSILTSVWRHAEHLSGYKQQDAHELYMSMLDGLHQYTEQGAAARVAGQTGPGGVPVMCPCIIHTVYGGLLRSDVQCGTCQTVSTTHEPMFDISLDLSSVSRSLPSTPTAATTPPSLVECLRRFTTAEKLWQHDQFLCRTCSAYSEATKQLSLHSLPMLLCVHFKRFEHLNAKQSNKIDTLISFPITALDLAPYLHSALPTPLSPSIKAQHPNAALMEERRRAAGGGGGGGAVYDLLSVVVHKGSLETGHYLCYMKCGGQWYRNDDKLVVKVSDAEVSSCQAYLLFYIRQQMPVQ